MSFKHKKIRSKFLDEKEILEKIMEVSKVNSDDEIMGMSLEREL